MYRCDWSDLLVRDCAHCRGLTLDDKLIDTPAERWGNHFEARYPGVCAECGGTFPAGQRIIRFGDDQYAHTSPRFCEN